MDRDAFDALMASLDPPMVIVTAAAGDERAGCLVGFHGQCSIEPRRYALWLSKANRTFRVAVVAGHLGVHLLSEADRDLAELFGGQTGDDVDKFARCDLETSPEGVPLLRRCPHRLVGRRLALADHGGDHVCVVVEPVAAVTAGRFAPLRLSQIHGIEAGHAPGERPLPPDMRARAPVGPAPGEPDPPGGA